MNRPTGHWSSAVNTHSTHTSVPMGHKHTVFVVRWTYRPPHGPFPNSGPVTGSPESGQSYWPLPPKTLQKTTDTHPCLTSDLFPEGFTLTNTQTCYDITRPVDGSRCRQCERWGTGRGHERQVNRCQGATGERNGTVGETHTLHKQTHTHTHQQHHGWTLHLDTNEEGEEGRQTYEEQNP